MKDEQNKDELVDFRVHSLQYKTKLTRKFRERKKYQVPDPKEVRSVIPGTVLDVKVKNGQKVKEGEVLLELEAMKMVNEIHMPFDGKIKQMNVEKGQKISKNFVMVELE